MDTHINLTKIRELCRKHLVAFGSDCITQIYLAYRGMDDAQAIALFEEFEDRADSLGIEELTDAVICLSNAALAWAPDFTAEHRRQREILARFV